ncbi:hypothetical protein BG011_008342 [Mortierella polycephala]|uniref:C2H2-type domain-containing protein n=1 Tax=Mortierella polycephala TaxID=41804 RepID=A0A9P6PRA9_9FUNG|nr:hypothetical protein BG011_008342 [Mortierella polycephala]
MFHNNITSSTATMPTSAPVAVAVTLAAAAAATATTATATTATATTATASPSGAGTPNQLLMSHNTMQFMSTSIPSAKKKPRNQGSGVAESLSFQDSFQSDPSLEVQDAKAISKKKLAARKGPSSNQPETEPQQQQLEIRFVMSDKDGQEKPRSQKQGPSSTTQSHSPSQDTQAEDAADQEPAESSPTPDFEKNADGKYRCSWPRCGKEFTVASRLTTHFRIHSGKPPYLCGYKDCQKAFHTSSSLSHHRVVHTDQGLRPYVCRHNRCGATYTQLARLITHQRTTHSGMILFIPQDSSSSPSSSPSQTQAQSQPSSATVTPSAAIRDDPFASTSSSQPSTPITSTAVTSAAKDPGRRAPEAIRQSNLSPLSKNGRSTIVTQQNVGGAPTVRASVESAVIHGSQKISPLPMSSSGNLEREMSETKTSGDFSKGIRAYDAVRKDEQDQEGQAANDEESDEMRQKREAALTMASIRDLAMQQQPQRPYQSTSSQSSYPPTYQQPPLSNGLPYPNNEYQHPPPPPREYPKDAYYQYPPHPASSYATSQQDSTPSAPARLHSHAPHSREYWDSHGRGGPVAENKGYDYPAHDRTSPQGQRIPPPESQPGDHRYYEHDQHHAYPHSQQHFQHHNHHSHHPHTESQPPQQP